MKRKYGWNWMALQITGLLFLLLSLGFLTKGVGYGAKDEPNELNQPCNSEQTEDQFADTPIWESITHTLLAFNN